MFSVLGCCGRIQSLLAAWIYSKEPWLDVGKMETVAKCIVFCVYTIGWCCPHVLYPVSKQATPP
jgi:hypothetical protein